MAQLFVFELKKLLQRRVTWVALALCMLWSAIAPLTPLLGNAYVEGEVYESHADGFWRDLAYARSLSGRALDDALIGETWQAMRQIPVWDSSRLGTEVYETLVRPYNSVWQILQRWTGLDEPDFCARSRDLQEIRALRTERVRANWRSLHLTQAEQAFWEAHEATIPEVLTLREHHGYTLLLELYLSFGVLTMLFISVALGDSFATEHTRRTDLLLWSTPRGYRGAYYAKMLAGLTVGGGGCLLLCLPATCVTLGLYGLRGGDTALQLIAPFVNTSYPLSLAQACAICYAALFLCALVLSLLVMLLSETTRSGLVTVAIATALVIAGGLVEIPDAYRVLAQIWNAMPFCFPAIWNVLDVRPVTLFGVSCMTCVAVPALYVLLCPILLHVGRRLFQRMD